MLKFPKAKLEYAFKGSDKILLIVGKVILKSVSLVNQVVIFFNKRYNLL